MYYPPEAQMEKLQGTVEVEFVVEKDGSLSGIHIKKGVHRILDNAAIKIIKKMPKWEPAIQDGEIVRSNSSLPLKFIVFR